MRRRAFLAGVGVLLGSWPVRAVLGREEPEPEPGRWPLGCRLASYGAYKDAAWTHLPSLGVSRVYLEVPEASGVKALRERLAAHGLSTPVLGGHVPLGLADAVARLDAQLASCKELGAKYMFLSAKHEGISREDAYAKLREAGGCAARHGVTIVLETHPDLGTNAATHLETMRKVDHPHVRVNFDTGNLSYYNDGAVAARELERIIEYVATVELKDHDLKPKSWYFPALGEGKVDFPGVFRVLEARGFSGPVTIEVEGISGRSWTEAETKRAIERSVRYARGLHPFD